MIRRDLIDRIQNVFDSQPKFRDMEIRSFGSFASGLYLPVADMDLVILSPGFRRYGRETFVPYRRTSGGRISIYEVARVIERANVVASGSMEIISGARVPILKWVDRLTGLKVDMAFDNDSGIRAIKTFEKWKEAYPAMPAIVAVVKQFLLLRSLNEVPTGGLGGFSIICLVVSLLQHMPHHLNGHGPSLGSILMDFFDFYGNKFDFSSVGIRLEPPGYFNKVSSLHTFPFSLRWLYSRLYTATRKRSACLLKTLIDQKMTFPLAQKRLVWSFAAFLEPTTHWNLEWRRLPFRRIRRTSVFSTVSSQRVTMNTQISALICVKSLNLSLGSSHTIGCSLHRLHLQTARQNQSMTRSMRLLHLHHLLRLFNLSWRSRVWEYLMALKTRRPKNRRKIRGKRRKRQNRMESRRKINLCVCPSFLCQLRTTKYWRREAGSSWKGEDYKSGCVVEALGARAISQSADAHQELHSLPIVYLHGCWFPLTIALWDTHRRDWDGVFFVIMTRLYVYMSISSRTYAVIHRSDNPYGCPLTPTNSNKLI